MNEFELQSWEREAGAWRRRLERQPPGELRSSLCAIADELARLRGADPPDEDQARERLMRGFAELRALYDRAAGGDSATTSA